MDHLLSALLSPDNDARGAAEAAYNQALHEQTDNAASALIASLAAPDLGVGERSLGCVLASRLARNAPLRAAVQPDTVARLQSVLLACAGDGSGSLGLRNAASLACVQWAAALGSSHPETLMHQCVEWCRGDSPQCVAGAGLLRRLVESSTDNENTNTAGTSGRIAIDFTGALALVQHLLLEGAVPVAAALSASEAGLAIVKAALQQPQQTPAAAAVTALVSHAGPWLLPGSLEVCRRALASSDPNEEMGASNILGQVAAMVATVAAGPGRPDAFAALVAPHLPVYPTSLVAIAQANTLSASTRAAALEALTGLAEACSTFGGCDAAAQVVNGYAPLLVALLELVDGDEDIATGAADSTAAQSTSSSSSGLGDVAGWAARCGAVSGCTMDIDEDEDGLLPAVAAECLMRAVGACGNGHHAVASLWPHVAPRLADSSQWRKQRAGLLVLALILDADEPSAPEGSYGRSGGSNSGGGAAEALAPQLPVLVAGACSVAASAEAHPRTRVAALLLLARLASAYAQIDDDDDDDDDEKSDVITNSFCATFGATVLPALASALTPLPEDHSGQQTDFLAVGAAAADALAAFFEPPEEGSTTSSPASKLLQAHPDLLPRLLAPCVAHLSRSGAIVAAGPVAASQRGGSGAAATWRLEARRLGCVLGAVGALATSAGSAMLPHASHLLPLLLALAPPPSATITISSAGRRSVGGSAAVQIFEAEFLGGAALAAAAEVLTAASQGLESPVSNSGEAAGLAAAQQQQQQHVAEQWCSATAQQVVAFANTCQTPAGRAQALHAAALLAACYQAAGVSEAFGPCFDALLPPLLLAINSSDVELYAVDDGLESEGTSGGLGNGGGASAASNTERIALAAGDLAGATFVQGWRDGSAEFLKLRLASRPTVLNPDGSGGSSSGNCLVTVGVDLEQLESKETSARALFALCRAVGPTIVAPHVPQLLPAAVNLLSNLFSDALPLLAAALVPDFVANACLMSQGGDNGQAWPPEWARGAGEEALQACLAAAWVARGALDRSAAAHASAATASTHASGGSAGGGSSGIVEGPNSLWRPSLIKVRLLSVCLDSAADVLQALASCHLESAAASGRKTTGVRSEVASACLESLWAEVERILSRRQERRRQPGSYAATGTSNEADDEDEAATEEDEWEEDRMASIVRATAAVLSAPGVLLPPHGFWWQFAVPRLANTLTSSRSETHHVHDVGDNDAVLQALALDALSGALVAAFEPHNSDGHACGAWADVLGLVVGESMRVLSAGLSHGHEETSGDEDDSSNSDIEQRWIAAVSALAMVLATLPSPAHPRGRNSDDVASFAGLDDPQLLQNMLQSVWLPLKSLLIASVLKHAKGDDDDDDDESEDTSCGEAAAAAVVLLLYGSSRGAIVASLVNELASQGSSTTANSNGSTDLIHALLTKLPLTGAPTLMAQRAHGALVGAFVRNEVGINVNELGADPSALSSSSQHQQLAAWLSGFSSIRIAHKAAIEAARDEGPLSMLIAGSSIVSGGSSRIRGVDDCESNGGSTVLDVETAAALGQGGALQQLLASLPAGTLESLVHRGHVSIEHVQALMN